MTIKPRESPYMQARLAATLLLLLLPTSDSHARIRHHASAIPVAQPASGPRATEHVYRVVGRVRFLLFWSGSHDVGSARVHWDRDGSSEVISLLVGSDPRIAPRDINEWGYVREQVDDDRATVFGVRTLDNPDSLDQAEARLAEGTGSKLFGALCSIVTPTADRTATTSVRASDDVTYRDLARLVESAMHATHWTRRDISRPSDAAPGFLTALQRLLRANIATAAPATSLPYVYKGAVYELQLHHTQRLPELQLTSGTYRDVARSRATIHNRSTGDATSFTLAYGTRGALAAIPIYAAYEPHWWLKIELLLDEQVDAPRDPLTNSASFSQVSSMCGAHLRSEWRAGGSRDVPRHPSER